jgi:hypothetical protein
MKKKGIRTFSIILRIIEKQTINNMINSTIENGALVESLDVLAIMKENDHPSGFVVLQYQTGEGAGEIDLTTTNGVKLIASKKKIDELRKLFNSGFAAGKKECGNPLTVDDLYDVDDSLEYRIDVTGYVSGSQPENLKITTQAKDRLFYEAIQKNIELLK